MKTRKRLSSGTKPTTKSTFPLLLSGTMATQVKGKCILQDMVTGIEIEEKRKVFKIVKSGGRERRKLEREELR